MQSKKNEYGKKHLSDGKSVFGNINYWTICKQLKKVIKEAGIEKSISFHCSRHCFGTLALSKGMSIESVSRILGHTNIVTTQIYAKITTQKIDKDMILFGNKLNLAFNGIKVSQSAMSREIITMDECGKVFLPYSDEIWMRETELMDLFGAIAPTFRAAVKAVYKSRALKDCNTRQTIRLDNGYLDEVYNIEMIIALAFRFDTFGASQVRKAIVVRMMSPRKEKQMLVLSLGGKVHNTGLISILTEYHTLVGSDARGMSLEKLSEYRSQDKTEVLSCKSK